MRRRRGIGVLGLVGRTLLLFVLGAGVMLAALRFQLIPASLLGSAPAQTAVSLAATSAPGIAPASATALPSLAAQPAGLTATAIPSTPTAQVAPSPTQPRALAADAARRYLQAWQQQ